MSTSIKDVSFCIPVYNEASIIEQQLKKIEDGLKNTLGKTNYEIVVVDNGSTDKTQSIVKNISLRNKRIKIFSVGKRGHGLAVRKAIEKARYNNIIISATDLPFGFSDLKNVLPLWDKYDIIFGSKAHSKSIIFIPFQRNIFSYAYRFLLRLLFHISIKDTQGSLFLKKDIVLPILRYCHAQDAFFSGQLAIFGHMKKLRMTEVPVIMNQYKTRKSKFNVLSEGEKMLLSVLKTYLYYRKIDKSI